MVVIFYFERGERLGRLILKRLKYSVREGRGGGGGGSGRYSEGG